MRCYGNDLFGQPRIRSSFQGLMDHMCLLIVNYYCRFVLPHPVGPVVFNSSPLKCFPSSLTRKSRLPWGTGRPCPGRTQSLVPPVTRPALFCSMPCPDNSSYPRASLATLSTFSSTILFAVRSVGSRGHRNPQFTDDETEAQRGEVTCSGSHNW